VYSKMYAGCLRCDDVGELQQPLRFIRYLFPWTGHVETCVLLYHKDYTVGEKGKKVTVEVGMNK